MFQCDRDKSAALLTAMTISQSAFLLVLGSIAWELKETDIDTEAFLQYVFAWDGATAAA